MREPWMISYLIINLLNEIWINLVTEAAFEQLTHEQVFDYDEIIDAIANLLIFEISEVRLSSKSTSSSKLLNI